MDEHTLERLRNTRSSNEWDAICDEIKAANGGGYPADWFTKVMLSGLTAEAAANWL